VSLAAALAAGAFAWSAARLVAGERVAPAGLGLTERALRGRAPRRGEPRVPFQIWLSQAGAAVTPRQFWASSAALGAVTFTLLLALSGAPVVALLPSAAAAAAPYGYWSSQRRKLAQGRAAAWPDGLRYLVGSLSAGVATLHEALEELARSGPGPLRAPMARYVRVSARLGQRQALETVRAELADPVSDPVLLALGGAAEEGTETVLRVLRDLVSQITADLQLAEKIHTLQTQSRVATWGCFALPYVVLVFLCATNDAYRAFFSRPLGLLLVLVGAVMSLAGLLVARRLVRPIATSSRVFVNEGAQ
jgi:tight adherence protein B